ncbi:hypothetical protein DNTS_010286 [Danionella cerebrum]|uniref:Uncharacterized protein n=1 Tax=Danionella cerebrum TaxID=2873325 RepID=A0A553MRB3_9TELE|nr:hypothetical protein DNTS_010286 [Danionella translucida]
MTTAPQTSVLSVSFTKMKAVRGSPTAGFSSAARVLGRCGMDASESSADDSSGRQHVNVLLELSEEDPCRDSGSRLQMHFRSAWQDAVEGWRRLPCSPLRPQSQRRGRAKPEPAPAHCLLCADLDAPAAPEPAHLEASEPPALRPSMRNTSVHAQLPGDEPRRSPAVAKPHTGQAMKDTAAAPRIRSFSVLPPVRESRMLQKKLTEDSSSPTGSDLICAHRFTGIHFTPPNDSAPSPPPQFPLPLGGRHFSRQEELGRSSTRSSREYTDCLKAQALRRAEAHPLILIGTRVQMPM